jgi:hypothetical protein
VRNFAESRGCSVLGWDSQLDDDGGTSIAMLLPPPHTHFTCWPGCALVLQILGSPTLLPSYTAVHNTLAILTLTQPSSAPLAELSGSVALPLPNPDPTLDTRNHANAAGHCQDSTRRLYNVSPSIVTTPLQRIVAEHRYGFRVPSKFGGETLV